MSFPLSFRDRVLGNSPFKVELRVAFDGAIYTSDDVTGWELRIYEIGPKPQLVKQVLGGPASDVLDAVVPWEEDEDGKNFTYPVASDLWHREGGRSYRFEFLFLTDDTATGPVPMWGEIAVEASYK